MSWNVTVLNKNNRYFLRNSYSYHDGFPDNFISQYYVKLFKDKNVHYAKETFRKLSKERKMNLQRDNLN